MTYLPTFQSDNYCRRMDFFVRNSMKQPFFTISLWKRSFSVIISCSKAIFLIVYSTAQRAFPRTLDTLLFCLVLELRPKMRPINTLKSLPSAPKRLSTDINDVGTNDLVPVTDFKFLGINFRVTDADLPGTGKIQEFW